MPMNPEHRSQVVCLSACSYLDMDMEMDMGVNMDTDTDTDKDNDQSPANDADETSDRPAAAAPPCALPFFVTGG